MSTDTIADVLLVIAGLVNAVPGAVALSVKRAEKAYGVDVDGPDLAVVMRHRSVLLLAIGLALIAAPWWPEIRTAAIVLGLASMGTFIAIVAATPRVATPLRTVMWADAVAIWLLPASVALRSMG